jgi:Na+-transporting methylmalonyl-CoA/oxaloacetate decarboxylase gamma subunit
MSSSAILLYIFLNIIGLGFWLLYLALFIYANPFVGYHNMKVDVNKQNNNKQNNLFWKYECE